MTVQRWTDEILDRQADQIAEDRARTDRMSQQIEALLEALSWSKVSNEKPSMSDPALLREILNQIVNQKTRNELTTE